MPHKEFEVKLNAPSWLKFAYDTSSNIGATSLKGNFLGLSNVVLLPANILKWQLFPNPLFLHFSVHDCTYILELGGFPLSIGSFLFLNPQEIYIIHDLPDK
jgi:hypothetical protein